MAISTNMLSRNVACTSEEGKCVDFFAEAFPEDDPNASKLTQCQLRVGGSILHHRRGETKRRLTMSLGSRDHVEEEMQDDMRDLRQWIPEETYMTYSTLNLHSHCLSFSLLHSVCFILIAFHSHSHCFILIVILIACDSVRSLSLLVMIGSLIQSLRHCLSSFLQYEIVCRCTIDNI